MRKHFLLNQAQKLCHDWDSIQNRLIGEKDQIKKERLLYEELLLERSLQRLAETYRYYCD
ncbi:MAG: hypothetical protein COV52_09670 [Gammaproteobacteria bacterium CG11_big_fil_rev_8_21_14_0_20_46_22]|nr:MAG: hypothetical protein COV52_09670 [Gammaproteobacteria bacterium CG11_big_fil_rev_8_21_14_0_20_46_22]